MVKAWIADVTSLLEKECYERYYRKVPDFRKKKADVLRLDQMKAQSVGVWALWQKIQTEYHLPENAAFNFSHSGNYVMCAACMDGENIQVGCDIEKTGELKMKLARRYFCREEYDTILKESFMKATGRGMALPVNSFCIRMGEPPDLIRQPAEFAQKYYYREYRIEGLAYKMAVCSTDKDIDTELHTELTL